MKNLYTSKSEPFKKEPGVLMPPVEVVPQEPVKKDNTKIILIVLGLILIIGLFYFQKLNKVEND